MALAFTELIKKIGQDWLQVLSMTFMGHADFRSQGQGQSDVMIL